MPFSDAESQGFLGDFSRVDQTDPADFVGRLDTMQGLEFFRSYKKETFALMDLPKGGKGADVGCGTGDDALRMAEIVGESGHIAGFDISEAMIKEARARHAAAMPHLEFIHCPANDLKASSSSFDAVRADRVITHVPDVSAALREMTRIVKPGGRVVVSEPDMLGCWVVNEHHAITDSIMQAIANSCEQPYAARNLYYAFQDAGLVDVRLILRSTALTEPEPVNNILKFAPIMDSMIKGGKLRQEDAALWLEEFNDRCQRGRFLAGVTIFIAVGVKAAGSGD